VLSEWLFKYRKDIYCHLPSFFLVCSWQQNGKFITAKPGNHIGVIDSLTDSSQLVVG
jgi:hypothetical protein